MRKLVYTLANDETVNTETEAKASGLDYIVAYVEIEEQHSALTEKQRANRKAVKALNPHINSKGEYHRALK